MSVVKFLLGPGALILGGAAVAAQYDPPAAAPKTPMTQSTMTQSSMEQTSNAKSAMGMESTMLSGSQEVPPVETRAMGQSKILIGSDRTVSGTVETSGIEGTAAHIHQAAKGQNGPVLVTLTKTSANVWSVPAGTSLTTAQYDSFKAGEMYVNVHSAAHPNGEIRMQLR